MVQTVGKEAALQYAQVQSDAEPENLDKMRALVHLLKINDRTEDSLAVCEKMERIATRDADIIFINLAKGMLLASVDRHDEAKTAYEKALKVDPDQPMVLNNLAYLLGEHLNRPAEAEAYARQAVKLIGDNPDFLDTLGWLLYQNKQVGEARGMLLRALDHDRQNSAALYHLGVIYKETGNVEDAKTRLEQAREHATRTKDPNQLLPKIEQALKDLDAAGGE
jgi:Tfp pilus assembly protein PilF